jgi:hypothetical protein
MLDFGGDFFLCWNCLTTYESWEPIRNRVVVPARQATQSGGIDSLESILGLLKYKIWALKCVGFRILIPLSWRRDFLNVPALLCGGIGSPG